MRPPDHQIARAGVCLAGLLLLGAATAQEANWEITPRLTLSETWTDNATLGGAGEEQSDWVTAVAPGIEVIADTARLKGLLDYEYQYLWYLDERDFSDGYHNLGASGTAEIIEQHFFLDGLAEYSQADIDPLGKVAQSNIYRTGNRTDYFLLGMEPYWQDRFG
ncbi:MAG: TIGR03016 family PEP-CTERM system-associated outer membrane protein, partial [Gammaproteobacteria bacterium]